MIEVFIYGCITCGTNSLLAKRLQAKYPETLVYRSVPQEIKEQHIKYLNRAGIETNGMPPIIVVDGGERILSLSQWNTL